LQNRLLRPALRASGSGFLHVAPHRLLDLDDICRRPRCSRQLMRTFFILKRQKNFGLSQKKRFEERTGAGGVSIW
jgi:hypothetical protein